MLVEHIDIELLSLSGRISSALRLLCVRIDVVETVSVVLPRFCLWGRAQNTPKTAITSSQQAEGRKRGKAATTRNKEERD